jgi:hypothetical protein
VVSQHKVLTVFWEKWYSTRASYEPRYLGKCSVGYVYSSKSSNISEEQAFTLRMDMAKLLSCELVSEIAVIKVHSAEGGGNTTKEGK